MKTIESLSVNGILRFLSSLVLISTFLPVLFANLPGIFKSHHLYVALWIVGLIVFRMKVFFSIRYFSWLLYVTTMILMVNYFVWESIDDWNKKALLNEIYEISVALSILNYYTVVEDYDGLAKLSKLSLICVTITATISILVSYINPMYVRDLTGLGAYALDSQREEILIYKRYGGGEYSFFTAIVSLFPILVYFYKENRLAWLTKIQISSIFALLFIAIVSVQIFANILIMLLFIILSTSGSKNIKKSVIILVLIVIGYLSIPSNYYIKILSETANLFDSGSENYYKLNDMSLYLAYGENLTTSAGGRAERFPMLLESFLSNPLIGGKEWNGHMFWMNKLAVFGLLGTIPFLAILFSFIKNISTRYNLEYRYYFLLSLSSIIGLGFFKNLAGRDTWYMFFVIIPGIYYTLKQRSTPDA
jgi:hypothetical protein